MPEPTKPPPPPSPLPSLAVPIRAADLLALAAGARAPRPRFCIYAFAAAFLGFTLYLAFFSPSAAPAWFSALFSASPPASAPVALAAADTHRNGIAAGGNGGSIGFSCGEATEKAAESLGFMIGRSRKSRVRGMNRNPNCVTMGADDDDKEGDPHKIIGDRSTEVGNSTKNQSRNSDLAMIGSGNVGNSSEKGVNLNGTNRIVSAAAVTNMSNTSALGITLKIDRNADDDWIKAMIGCDMFVGNWVEDISYPLYPEGSCPHIDEPFDCYRNGRPDRSYQRLRWQPIGCRIPRFNATDMLERLRGKRLVFVGDSLNRNMWESLVCALQHSVDDKSKVFEVSGRQEFRTEGSYSFIFKDYNCSIEFFRSTFLVQEAEMPTSNGSNKETLRLDLIDGSAPKYKDANIIIFNTGHWWTHEKTAKGEDYYQEGNHVYSELNVFDAFRKALNTWARWVDSNVDANKTTVMFRGYSASHFRGGQWNSGGQCNKETEPIKNEQYLAAYPPKMSILEEVIRGMKTPVVFLNVTRMTDYRKDGHPSIYRKQNMTEEERRSPERFQDCSHWCLPGLPDSWNELLYLQLVLKQYQMDHWQ